MYLLSVIQGDLLIGCALFENVEPLKLKSVETVKKKNCAATRCVWMDVWIEKHVLARVPYLIGLLLLVLLIFACRSFLGSRFGSRCRHGTSGGRSRGHHVLLGLSSVAYLLSSGGLSKDTSQFFRLKKSGDGDHTNNLGE